MGIATIASRFGGAREKPDGASRSVGGRRWGGCTGSEAGYDGMGGAAQDDPQGEDAGRQLGEPRGRGRVRRGWARRHPPDGGRDGGGSLGLGAHLAPMLGSAYARTPTFYRRLRVKEDLRITVEVQAVAMLAFN